ncbi:MAG TPA: hypothetical protein VHX49_04020 [Candidatus Acidoferrales bacterium]|nr:hypothetical protein [Candidatus Acidoferrales bacterium]
MIELLLGHGFELLADLLGAFWIEELATFESLFDGALEIFERVRIELAELHVGIVEAALQKEIGESAHQVFGGEAEVVTGVAGVMNAFHRLIPFIAKPKS